MDERRAAPCSSASGTRASAGPPSGPNECPQTVHEMHEPCARVRPQAPPARRHRRHPHAGAPPWVHSHPNPRGHPRTHPDAVRRWRTPHGGAHDNARCEGTRRGDARADVLRRPRPRGCAGADASSRAVRRRAGPHPTAEPTAHIDASGHVHDAPHDYDAQGHACPPPRRSTLT